MHMTIDEAIQAVDTGGAAALQRTARGRITPGSAGYAVASVHRPISLTVG